MLPREEWQRRNIHAGEKMKSTGRRETTYARSRASLFYLDTTLCIRPLSHGWYAPPASPKSSFPSLLHGDILIFSPPASPFLAAPPPLHSASSSRLFAIYLPSTLTKSASFQVISFGQEPADTIVPPPPSLPSRRAPVDRPNANAPAN